MQRCRAVSSMSKFPWIFQRLADVSSICKEPIKTASGDQRLPSSTLQRSVCLLEKSSTRWREGLLLYVSVHNGQCADSPPRGHLLLRLPVPRSRRGLLIGDALAGFHPENSTRERLGECFYWRCGLSRFNLCKEGCWFFLYLGYLNYLNNNFLKNKVHSKRFLIIRLFVPPCADWRIARSSGEAEEQRDALGEKAWMVTFGKQTNEK